MKILFANKFRVLIIGLFVISIFYKPPCDGSTEDLPFEEIYALDKKAFDGNITAIDSLFLYYLHKDYDKAKFWLMRHNKIRDK